MRREDGVERFTYRQLDDLSRRAASFLVAAGIAPGDRCAILGENSARWVAVYLGTLRIGAIAVPLDTACKTSQVVALLRDCGAEIVLTSTRFEDVAREAAGAAGCRVAPLQEALAGGDGLEGSSLQSSPSDPAVILYTSGTTGDPKGVVLTHANLLAGMDGTLQVVGVSELDSIVTMFPLFHALGQMANLLLPFSTGAHVVFIDTRNTRELFRTLDEERTTVLAGEPRFFSLIHKCITTEIRFPWLFRRVHRTLGRRVRLMITGGSKLDEAIGRDLHDLGFTMLQAYGLTETSGAATIGRPGEPIGTVGKALPGVDIRTLQDEVLVRGPVVMKGYWNRPDATAEAIHDGWLHTGDLGRLDDEGRLTIVGRSKDVIVLGSGESIHPEELEEHYRQSHVIKELCVLKIASADEPSARRLHALVVPDIEVLRERKIVNVSELIRFELEGLSVSLPSHKRVPGFDVTMEALPRTTTGRLKRREVQKLYMGGSRAPRHELSIQPPTDDHVARIVALVQAAARPGVIVREDSNLELDLGLDSLERVELLVSLEQRFGRRVPEEVAQCAFLVRDVAEAFRGATGAAESEGPSWTTMLALQDPGPELRALLKPRPVALILVFTIAQLLVRAFVRPEVTGLEHLRCGGPFILSPNHQSYIDPMILMGVLPFRTFRRLFFVAAAEYFETTVVAWLPRRLNLVPVDPDANLLPAMQAGAFGLKHGKVLVLFPEGERSIDGTVKKFKNGAAILSQHLEVPIVPVAIRGVFEIWPRTRPLDWRRLLPWSGHHASVRFGPPISPPAPGTSYADHTAAVRRAVESMWRSGGSNRSNRSGS